MLLGPVTQSLTSEISAFAILGGPGYIPTMDIMPHDLVGLIGVSFIVATYFLSQIGRMDISRPLYPAVNGIGALLILFSLYFTFNAASFVIELFWLAISAVGLVRAFSKKKAAVGSTPSENTTKKETPHA